VGKRLAGPDETSLAVTLASRAPTAAQQIITIDLIYKIDLISETAESGIGALPSLASLSGPSLFGFRNDDARSEIDISAGTRRTNLTSRGTDRASSKNNRDQDRTKSTRIARHVFHP
jgi:hypothetical protein